MKMSVMSGTSSKERPDGCVSARCHRAALARLRGFLAEESGSATVEWVVITAWSTALALAVTSAVSSGVENLTTEIETFLSSFTIKTSFEEWRTMDSGSGAGGPTGGGGSGAG